MLGSRRGRHTAAICSPRSRRNPIRLPTGGMPITPPWTNGIIVYEMTMLGAILTTIVMLLIGAGLPNFKGVITDPEISGWERYW